MNLATIRSAMPWMRINAQQNSTRATCISKHDFSCFATAKLMESMARPALLCLKMFILKLTKRLEL